MHLLIGTDERYPWAQLFENLLGHTGFKGVCNEYKQGESGDRIPLANMSTSVDAYIHILYLQFPLSWAAVTASINPPSL